MKKIIHSSKKITTILFALFVLLITSVGLGSFVIANEDNYFGDVDEVGLEFSNSSTQKVIVNTYSMNGLNITSEGITDPTDPSGYSRYFDTYKFSVNMNITSTVTSNLKMKVSLSQGGDDVGINFINNNDTKLIANEIINQECDYDEINKKVTFESDTSTLGFISNGEEKQDLNFVISFTFDEELVNDYTNQIFEKMKDKNVTFKLRIEMFGEENV